MPAAGAADAPAPVIILLIPRRFIPAIAVRPAANNDMIVVVDFVLLTVSSLPCVCSLLLSAMY